MKSCKTERTHEIVDACMPRGTSAKLARYLSVSPELVNRWRRQPEADDDPYGTGINNPLDRVEAIQDHAFAHAPAESHRIHQYFAHRYEQHFSYRESKPFTLEARDQELADVHREMADAVTAILRRAPPDRVRKEWEDVKREMEGLVRMVERSGIEDGSTGLTIDGKKNGLA